jgi:hypothetical protein
MTDTPDTTTFRRDQLRKRFAYDAESSMEARIDRYIEVNHQNMVAMHHFTLASRECHDCYTHGHFIAAIMLSQAVAEGILKLMVERNSLQVQPANRESRLMALQQNGFLDYATSTAFTQIFRSFRNDYHHMNPPVGTIDHGQLARRNIMDQAKIERYLFGYTIDAEGRMVPNYPQYWDIGPDGMMPVVVNFQ